jgi:hypothetical protein
VTPESPSDVQVSLSETSANVTWLAPTNDGGTAISSYLVNLTSGDEIKTCRVAADVFTCTIDGLTEGLDYSVEVIAFSNQDQLQSQPGVTNLGVPAKVIEPEPEPAPIDEPYVDPRPYEAINPVEDDPVGVAEKTWLCGRPFSPCGKDQRFAPVSKSKAYKNPPWVPFPLVTKYAVLPETTAALELAF